MLTTDEIYEVLSTINEDGIEYKNHFLLRLNTRARISSVVPNNLEEIKKILLNRCPVYVDYQGNNEYKVFYDITDKRDLVVVLWLRVTSPTKIKFITLYPQDVRRRLKKNER